MDNKLQFTTLYWNTAIYGAPTTFPVLVNSEPKTINDPSVADFSSCKGRTMCFSTLFATILPIALFPLAMLICTIRDACLSGYYKCKGNDELAEKYGWTALDRLCMTLTGSVLFTILAVRAAFGFIVHPRCYYNPTLASASEDKSEPQLTTS